LSWSGGMVRAIAAAAGIVVLFAACRPLQTARVRQEVTVDVYGAGPLA